MECVKIVVCLCAIAVAITVGFVAALSGQMVTGGVLIAAAVIGYVWLFLSATSQ
jgi:hypothetical protein